MLYTPSTQPGSVADLIGRSFRLYRVTFTRVFLLALVLSLVAFIPRILIHVTGRNYFADSFDFNPNQLWLILIQIVCLTIFTIILWRIRCIKYGAHETLQDDMRITLKRIPYIVGAAIVQTGIIWLISLTTLGFYYFLDKHTLYLQSTSPDVLFLAIPLILQLCLNTFIFFLLIFYLPLILTENKHVFSALSKSARLVWGYWWRTFIVQITPGLFYLILSIAIKNLTHMKVHLYATPINELSIPNTLLHILLLAAFIPWFGSTLLVQLQDLELRKDAEASLKITQKTPHKKKS